MEMDKEITKVIFRKWKDTGDIIAIFPEIPADQSLFTCLSYVHVGQHGACNLNGNDNLIDCATELAKPEEYKDLLEELQSLGYNLKVYKRYTYAMAQNRWKEMGKYNE